MALTSQRARILHYSNQARLGEESTSPESGGHKLQVHVGYKVGRHRSAEAQHRGTHHHRHSRA